MSGSYHHRNTATDKNYNDSYKCKRKFLQVRKKYDSKITWSVNDF